MSGLGATEVIIICVPLLLFSLGSWVFSKRMRTFRVYHHPTRGFEVVKAGFSWPAFFFGAVWLLVKRFWGVAALFFAVYLVLVCIEEFANAAQSKPGAQAPVYLIVAAGYAAMALVPALKGNLWRIENLQKRGYEFLQEVRAQTTEAAVAHVARAAATKENQAESLYPKPRPQSTLDSQFVASAESASRDVEGATTEPKRKIAPQRDRSRFPRDGRVTESDKQNRRPASGLTASLLQGVLTGRISRVRSTLAHGADPLGRNSYGATALQLAVLHGESEIVQMLLKRGADPNVTDAHGRTCAQIAQTYGFDDIVVILEER